MYLRVINQKPSLLNDESLKRAYDGEDISRSVYKRLDLLLAHYGITGTEIALIDLVINWRNRLTHFNAANDITTNNRKKLMHEYTIIKENYNGLDIHLALKKFDRGDAPTFKEVASLIRATIGTVYVLDAKLVSQTDTRTFADAIIINHFLENKNVTQKDYTTYTLRGTRGLRSHSTRYCASVVLMRIPTTK